MDNTLLRILGIFAVIMGLIVMIANRRNIKNIEDGFSKKDDDETKL